MITLAATLAAGAVGVWLAYAAVYLYIRRQLLRFTSDPQFWKGLIIGVGGPLAAQVPMVYVRSRGRVLLQDGTDLHVVATSDIIAAALTEQTHLAAGATEERSPGDDSDSDELELVRLGERHPDRVLEQVRSEWRQKLEASVKNGGNLVLDHWDLHELYTGFVESSGPEGCTAGCTILPPGWCATCDSQRKEHS